MKMFLGKHIPDTSYRPFLKRLGRVVKGLINFTIRV